MTTNNIISFEWSYLDAVAKLYQTAYAVPQYGDLSSQEISRELIVGHILRESFIGVLAVESDRRVIGSAWGYASPNDNARLKELVMKKLGEKWIENTFVVEVFALHPDHYQSDLADQLHAELVSHVLKNNYDRMRIRLERARLDRLLPMLAAQGWQQLQSLAHVVWMGKELAY